MKAGKGKGEGKTQGTVLHAGSTTATCTIHPSRGMCCESGRCSHTASFYVVICNMLVQVSAASEGYSSDSNLSAASSVRNSRTRQPDSPYVKLCDAFKHGDCAKGERCTFPQFNAKQLAAKKNDVAEKRDNGGNTVDSKGNTKGKRKGKKGQCKGKGRYAVCSHWS